MRNVKRYYLILGACALVQGVLWLFAADSGRVEYLFSKGWYTIYSYVPKLLFGWVPFSVGDVFYGTVAGLLLFWVFDLFRHLFSRQWHLSYIILLKTLSFIFVLYLFFYISWGINYSRQSLAESFSLPVDRIEKGDYYAVLEKYIVEANKLRKSIYPNELSREGVSQDLENMMRDPTPFDRMLSKSQVNVKYPLSSAFVSYFMVTGYFNPFTHEVHVNRKSPIISYPFTTVHELAHQMGVGFEDECNFIAFRMLINHDDPWYRYSAYYEAIQSLIRPIRFWDEEKAKEYYAMLGDEIKVDLQEKRLFWEEYHGVVDALSRPFYEAFLQHNKQPEGTERYSMMSRLIVAWELSNKEKL